MDQKSTSRVIVILGTIILLVLVVIGVALWESLRASPRTQFNLARHRWETNSVLHYRMVASYYGNRAQCYYDIEVRQDQLVHMFTSGCLSSGPSNTLTINGIFETFERYSDQKICSPNGCYCEGRFVIRATYEETLGYPQRISTVFQRSWVDDLLHGKIGVQQCLRTDPMLQRFERVKVTILP